MEITERVAAAVTAIIDRRHAARRAPEVARLTEVMEMIPGESRAAIIQAFRELHYSGRFRGSATINKEPMMIRRQ